ncbi:cytochrome c1 [Sphingosinicella sp. LHD-64]|uniref:cytochrome c1 n=1 Tax=Sphingosinicella sp. LHD-64 TaxID=3072139 RepID=UPI00280FABDB|nr:cytochrome c1 [Sphingosinicella sp. LHD-64]MDQ8755465.1 cytochrome c1 [Sphingosinicella sp. LHD-64]
MVRILGFLVGLGFVGVAAWSLLWGAIAYISEPPAETVEHRFHEHPRDISFSFDGPFGRYNAQQLQRGFQVYKEVCAACHGLHYVAFRDLHDLGYSEAEVRAIADQWQIQVPSINPDTGEPAARNAIPADRFPNPYANETAARAANNNALPPDLSLIVKAREGGAPYMASLLTGYQDPPGNLPAENRPGTGLHYNPYFANLNIAMPPPITADGQVTYADGTQATREQMAEDVSAFLAWAAEPKADQRKNMGIVVVLFLLIATILGRMAYKNVWYGPKREDEAVQAAE